MVVVCISNPLPHHPRKRARMLVFDGGCIFFVFNIIYKFVIFLLKNPPEKTVHPRVNPYPRTRVRVYWGWGTGWPWLTPGLPVPIPIRLSSLRRKAMRTREGLPVSARPHLYSLWHQHCMPKSPLCCRKDSRQPLYCIERDRDFSFVRVLVESVTCLRMT